MKRRPYNINPIILWIIALVVLLTLTIPLVQTHLVVRIFQILKWMNGANS